MKNFSLAFIIFFIAFLNATAREAIIVDHECADLEKIPAQWIEKAKSDLKIAYGHTSHGSQLVSGMEVWAEKSNSIYKFNSGEGSLDLHDRGIPGANDLGAPDRLQWATATRNLLEKPDCDRNLIIWSWCGQASTASQADIERYLADMTALENDFPEVSFVYMTGHLDGGGIEGNLHKRNEQIRAYCCENGKILFDFADIESYDPDGNYYLDKGADDGCNYWEDGEKRNWADEWSAAHPGVVGDCYCAHSKCLNCMLKGAAAWHTFARAAGWDGNPSAVEEDSLNYSKAFIYKIFPNPPQNDRTKITFYLPRETTVKLDVFDVNGNKVMTVLNNVVRPQGMSEEIIDTSPLSIGSYHYRLVAGSEVDSKMMVVDE